MVRCAKLMCVTLIFAGAALAKKKAEVPDDGLPSVDEVRAQVLTVYEELAGNTDPLVRRAAFEGLLALEGASAEKAIDAGLKDADWAIKERSLALALSGKNKTRRKVAEGALAKLLESSDEEDRTHGYAILEATAKPKAQLAATQIAARDGSPEARAAGRERLIKMGGKTAWKIIAAGLAEPVDQPEYKQATRVLETFSDPVGVSWALTQVQDGGGVGVLARDYLTRIEGKSGTKLDKTLIKTYEKSADFETRLHLANVIARRNNPAKVQRTLLAGLKYQKSELKILSWVAFSGSRDLALLGKLRERILSLTNEDHADAAYAWLTEWGASTGDPKVLEILQEAARSDRRELRLRAMTALTTLKHRASLPIFEAAMTEGQVEIRLAAARGMAATAAAGDETRISKFLRKEPDENVKLALIEGLANIGTPEIIDSLQFEVTARNPAIKVAAAKAVAGTGKPKAAQLLGLLKRDADPNVRFLAWHNLLRLDPLRTRKEFKSAMTWLSSKQVETLGADKKIDSALLELIALNGNDDQRTFAVDALRDREAATALLALFEKSKEADTAASALAGLAKLRKEASVATYRKGIEHRFGPVRAAAFDAIGLYGPRALLEQILGGLADKEPLARASAATAAFRLASREG